MSGPVKCELEEGSSLPKIPVLQGREDVNYKICDEDSWRRAEAAGCFEGAPVDLADGYIHFSTATQLRETAEKHFAGRSRLVLVAVEAEALGPALRYEPSRGGDLFPHLYAPLPLSAVLWTCALPLGEDGRHVFPDAIP